MKSDQNMAKIKYLACLGSSMYQRTVDELQDELNSFEHRLSTSATTAFYKRKIYDLEAICCADLNRVKSRFVRSLQAFENTIDSIEEPRSRRIGAEGCRCSKNHLTGYNVDAYRHERPATRNAKHDRSLPRSKYVRTRTLCTFMRGKQFYCSRQSTNYLSRELKGIVSALLPRRVHLFRIDSFLIVALTRAVVPRSDEQIRGQVDIYGLNYTGSRKYSNAYCPEVGKIEINLNNYTSILKMLFMEYH